MTIEIKGVLGADGIWRRDYGQVEVTLKQLKAKLERAKQREQWAEDYRQRLHERVEEIEAAIEQFEQA